MSKSSTTLKIKQLESVFRCENCLFGNILDPKTMTVKCNLDKKHRVWSLDLRCKNFVNKYKLPPASEVFNKNEQLNLF